MFSCLRDPDLHDAMMRTTPYVLQHAALFFTLLTIAAATGCGSSSPANSSPPPSASPGTLNVSASLPAATVGSSYSGSVSATGGTAPYKFSVSSGQLPGGVGLDDSTGKISGTPSANGSFTFAVSVSDASGDSAQKSLQISVANNSTTASGGGSGGGSSGGTGTSNGSNTSTGQSFSNIQRSGGWAEYGQGPPNFVDCSPSPCDGITFSMSQGVSSPSMSGSATEFDIGGTTPYSDALWNNHLIGPLSSQGTFDSDGTLVPSLHTFTYDVYFFASDFSPSEAIEFDINQFFDGMGFIFGHECRIDAGNSWDVWDSQNARWVSTGVPCFLNANAWNHLTLQVQRTSDNHQVYQSITLNGVTSTLNWTFGYGSTPGWYGITVNYQMDGNYKQEPYNIYLDNLTFTYQ
jgi:hypothetical protein